MSSTRSRFRPGRASLPALCRSPRFIACTFLLSIVVLSGRPREATADGAAAAITYPVWGFEDDVDVVVSPNGRFVVVCEETQDGDSARVEIIELDEATGTPLGVRLIHDALGFENGVEPFIVRVPDVDGGWAVLIPEESENGAMGGILVLRVADNGALLEEVMIDLGSLGFHPDVDGAWGTYTGPLLAFFALESEDGSTRGVIAIDIDTADSDGDGDPEFGSCTVASNSAVAVCDNSVFDDGITGLVDAMDPVAYELVGCCSRFVVPVSGPDGSDLIFEDFDPNFEPPMSLGHTSAKDLSAADAHPLDFPGWVPDVDISLFRSLECETVLPGNLILVPVASEDGGDLYLLGADAHADWIYSVDGGATAVPIPGYERGVDIVRWCGLGGDHANRLIVPVESPVTGDADVLIVDYKTGEFLSHIEDPAINPDITVLGFEVGVEPLLWTTAHALVPMENAAGTSAGLLCIDPDARVLSAMPGAPILGFARSVDPIVAPLTDPDRTLFVPVQDQAGGDANVLRFPLPPDVTAPGNLETINPLVTFSGFQPGVDLGLVKKTEPGGAYLMIPEEDAVSHVANLRFEVVPNAAVGRVLAAITPAVGAAPSKAYAFRTSDGISIGSFSLLGLESGVDMANGRGPVIRANPPEPDVPSGFESDTDPTFAWDIAAVGVHDLVRPEGPRMWFANPLRASGRIAWEQPAAAYARLDLLDVTGRRIRRLMDGPAAAGTQMAAWDGRDAGGRQVGAGVYFLRLQVGLGERRQPLVYLK